MWAHQFCAAINNEQGAVALFCFCINNPTNKRRPNTQSKCVRAPFNWQLWALCELYNSFFGPNESRSSCSYVYSTVLNPYRSDSKVRWFPVWRGQEVCSPITPVVGYDCESAFRVWRKHKNYMPSLSKRILLRFFASYMILSYDKISIYAFILSLYL